MIGANSMGVQFWWFYDVIAAAVILLCIFLIVRKGLVKASITLTGFVIAAVTAFSACGPIAETMYEQSARNSNFKKLDLTLESVDFIDDLGNYIETLGYEVRVDNDQLRKAFEDKNDPEEKIYQYVNNINGKKVDEEKNFINKLHEGYAVVISNYVAKRMNEYSAEYTAEAIRKNPEQIFELYELLQDQDTKRPASKYISDNFLQKPYATQTKLIAFLLIFVGIVIVTIVIVVSTGKNSAPLVGFVPNAISGILSIACGAIVIVAIAAVIRLNVVLGSNKMLFFNHEVIENTYVFKYFYELVSGL